jgi:hypothetical protein
MFLEKEKGNLALETNVAMFLSTNAISITSFWLIGFVQNLILTQYMHNN